jgi:hypothetical protein
MSNPTSNFNWQMPTNTDLVSQLPADFEVFGQAVDTSLADLKGGTTGQILSKNSNTDMDFIWTTAAPGDITGVGVTAPITGGGTSGDVTIGIASTAVVPSQTGNSGKYLTTDGTTSSWGTVSAGGLTLLSTTTLSGTSVTVSSISGSYKNLFVYAKNVNTSGNDYVRVRLNGDTGTNYRGSTVELDNATLGGYSGSYTFFSAGASSANTDFSNKNSSRLTIFRYTDTSLIDYEIAAVGYTGSSKFMETNQGRYNASAAITSITFFTNSGSNTFSNGTLYIYGES